MIDESFPGVVGVAYVGSAFFDKGFDSDFCFYVSFSVDSEGFFYGFFYGESVAVSSSFSFDLVASHGHVSRDDVFDRACEEVSVVGCPGGKRRTVKKSERHFFTPFVDGALEGIVSFSEFDEGVHKFEGGHRKILGKRIKDKDSRLETKD